MQIPLEVSFRGVEKTQSLETLLQRKVAKLERFHDRVTSCRIAIERSPVTTGNPFRVRIVLTVPPGSEIVAVKDSRDAEKNGQLQALVHDAFNAVERQLKQLGARQRWDRHVEELSVPPQSSP